MSNLYKGTVTLVASFVGEAKAGGVVERQLKHCGATADSFGSGELKQIIERIHAASALYIPDDAKKQQLLGELQRLAA